MIAQRPWGGTRPNTYRKGPEDDRPDTEPWPEERWVAAHLAPYPDRERRGWMERRLTRFLKRWHERYG